METPTKISTLKLIVTLIILVIIGIGLLSVVPTTWTDRLAQLGQGGNGDQLVPPTEPTADWATYEEPIQGYSFKFPQSLELIENDPINVWSLMGTGTTLVYPGTLRQGTNLDRAVVHILSTSTCPSFAPTEGTSVSTEVYNGMTFTVTPLRDAAMGGARATYTFYVTSQNSRCYIVEQEIMYHDISFLESAGVTDLPQPYDAAAIDETFTNILSTFTIKPAEGGTASSTVPEMI